MTTSGHPAIEYMRIDKWLWTARFYKTRSLAAQAIAAGHVKLAGHAVKPARDLRGRPTKKARRQTRGFNEGF